MSAVPFRRQGAEGVPTHQEIKRELRKQARDKLYHFERHLHYLKLSPALFAIATKIAKSFDPKLDYLYAWISQSGLCRLCDRMSLRTLERYIRDIKALGIFTIQKVSRSELLELFRQHGVEKHARDFPHIHHKLNTYTFSNHWLWSADRPAQTDETEFSRFAAELRAAHRSGRLAGAASGYGNQHGNTDTDDGAETGTRVGQPFGKEQETATSPVSCSFPKEETRPTARKGGLLVGRKEDGFPAQEAVGVAFCSEKELPLQPAAAEGRGRATAPVPSSVLSPLQGQEAADAFATVLRELECDLGMEDSFRSLDSVAHDLLAMLERVATPPDPPRQYLLSLLARAVETEFTGMVSLSWSKVLGTGAAQDQELSYRDRFLRALHCAAKEIAVEVRQKESAEGRIDAEDSFNRLMARGRLFLYDPLGNLEYDPQANVHDQFAFIAIKFGGATPVRHTHGMDEGWLVDLAQLHPDAIGRVRGVFYKVAKWIERERRRKQEQRLREIDAEYQRLTED